MSTNRVEYVVYWYSIIYIYMAYIYICVEVTELSTNGVDYIYGVPHCIKV